MYLHEDCNTPDSVVGANIVLDGQCAGNCSDISASLANASAASDLGADQLLHIFEQECSPNYEVKPNYLHSCAMIPSDSSDLGVSERCRRRTCEWMYDICDYFHLNREVVAVALYYVDRYFTLTFETPSGEKNPVTRKQFQLVALTGLYIGIKTHGESRYEDVSSRNSWSRLKFSLHVCANISRNQFTPQMIANCEQVMLNTLNWHMNPVVPSGVIIDSLVNYLPSNVDGSIAVYVYDCAKYLAELSVSVPALSLVYKPSVIAYASILYSFDTLGPKCFPPQRRVEYESLVVKLSCHHFESQSENITSSRRILEVICPNLAELFPSPSIGLRSPTSVSKF